MRKVLPYDASCEDITISKDLSFLSSFVNKKLNEGAKPYLTPLQRMEAKENSQEPETSKPTLNFTPYQAPTKPTNLPPPEVPSDGGYPSGGDRSGGGGSQVPEGPKGLNVSGPRKWGPSGYNQPGGNRPPEPERQEKPAPAPEPSASSFLSVQAPAAAKPAPAVAESAEMTEKQRMAAALFGGIGPNSAPPAPTPAPAPRPQPAAPAPAPAPVQKAPEPAPVSTSCDLLDFGDAPSVPSAPSAAPATSPSASHQSLGGDMLLLDMDSSSPSNAPPPAAPQPILGPMQVTTAQVGSMWGSLPTERRVQMQTSVGNCQELMTRLQSGLNVSPVEIIGMEGIAAGRVLPGNDPCFLHGKLAPPRIDVLVRTRDPGVAQRVTELIQSSLC
eukprot:TRINITY_DN28104_c0_g1_i2.p1 TRINITY_DN28104_c0_g1~~TRINITY_DN28104_c0_g1_i2.p1  ORF type:complete len:386 (-),score=94.62 TRINITY_DN28104_c0_g1_i2:179-1336(-)